MAENFEQNQVVELFRKTSDDIKKQQEENNHVLSETTEKYMKLEEKFNELDKKNEEITKKFLEEKEVRLNLEKEMKELEKKSVRVGNPYENKAPSVEDSESFKAFKKVIEESTTNNSAELYKNYNSALQKDFSGTEWGFKTLRSDVNTEGGILCHPEYYNMILKKITEVSPMRSICRVTPMSASRLQIPTRTTLCVGAWEGETIQAPISNSQYGRENLIPRRLTISAYITIQELMNSVFDMAAEINSDVAERFNQMEGAAFVSGSGVNQPKGFINDPNVTVYNSGVADDVGFDPVLDLTGQLKTGYNPIFLMNRRTKAKLIQKKDSMGRYLWVGGVQGSPNSIADFPYLSTFIDMPDIGAGNIPLAFGDFKRGYQIGDRMAMMLVRDDYTRAGLGEVVFTFHRFVDGKVVIPEAIKLLKCSV